CGARRLGVVLARLSLPRTDRADVAVVEVPGSAAARSRLLREVRRLGDRAWTLLGAVPRLGADRRRGGADEPLEIPARQLVVGLSVGAGAAAVRRRHLARARLHPRTARLRPGA